MKGARFVHANESGQGHRLDEAVIKQLTGDATITCRFLYGRHFTYSPTLRFFYCRTIGLLSVFSTGMLPPGPMVPFHYQFTEKEKIDDYWRMLVEEEGPGILAWISEVRSQRQRNGPPSHRPKYSPPRRNTARNKIWGEFCPREMPRRFARRVNSIRHT